MENICTGRGWTTFIECDPKSDLPEGPAWAYGAFLLKRFTNWDSMSREMELY